MRPRGGIASAFLSAAVAAMAACGSDATGPDEPTYYPITESRQVVYRPGDAIEYLYYGTLQCAEGTYEMSGWFTIMVSPQGLTDPMNGLGVLTLVENQDLAVTLHSTDGADATWTVNDYAYRYFVQDPANGSIEYYGDRIRDTLGEFFTVWFEDPYIPISSPFSQGQRETATYDRYLDEGGATSYFDTHTTTVEVTGKEWVSVPPGDFETYVMSWHDDTQGVLVRYQYVYPPIGIVKFVFPTQQPGCTGDVVLDMLDTNIDFENR